MTWNPFVRMARHLMCILRMTSTLLQSRSQLLYSLMTLNSEQHTIHGTQKVHSYFLLMRVENRSPLAQYWTIIVYKFYIQSVNAEHVIKLIFRFRKRKKILHYFNYIQMQAGRGVPMTDALRFSPKAIIPLLQQSIESESKI